MASSYSVGMGQASQQIPHTALMGMELQRRDEQAKIQNAHMQLQNEELMRKKAAYEAPIDITTHPAYLSLPEDQRPEALKFFVSNGLTDARGIGQTGKVAEGAKMIAESSSLFQKYLEPAVKAKQGNVMQKWNELTEAKSTGDPNKITKAQQAYDAVYLEYGDSLKSFETHSKTTCR